MKRRPKQIRTKLLDFVEHSSIPWGCFITAFKVGVGEFT